MISAFPKATLAESRGIRVFWCMSVDVTIVRIVQGAVGTSALCSFCNVHLRTS